MDYCARSKTLFEFGQSHIQIASLALRGDAKIKVRLVLVRGAHELVEQQIKRVDLTPALRAGDVLRMGHCVCFVDNRTCNELRSDVRADKPYVLREPGLQHADFLQCVDRPHLVESGEVPLQDSPERLKVIRRSDADAALKSFLDRAGSALLISDSGRRTYDAQQVAAD